MIADSMLRFGVTTPVLVDEDGVLIYGHGRLAAAVQLVGQGKSEFAELPVVVARGWTEAEKRGYRIFDNQSALLSTWDLPTLRTELEGLKLEFELTTLGFPEKELRVLGLSDKQGATDPDETPEPRKDPVVKRGDLWVLGEHRLLCGDATSEADVMRCINGAKPHLMVTDPPYGVNYDPMWRNRVKRQDGSLVGAKATGIVHNDARDDWRDAWALFKGKIAYVWHGGLHASVVQESLVASGLVIRSQIIWAKQQFVIGRGDYHWQHECCWYAVRKGQTGSWTGDRKQSTIWHISAPSGWMQVKEGPDAHQGIHSTQKPIECMKRPIENNSRKGDAVYEPFSGSGTTIVACEMTERKALAIELDPTYVQVAIERWQNFTGKTATLDGKTLEQIARNHTAKPARKPKEKRAVKDRPQEKRAPATA